MYYLPKVVAESFSSGMAGAGFKPALTSHGIFPINHFFGTYYKCESYSRLTFGADMIAFCTSNAHRTQRGSTSIETLWPLTIVDLFLAQTSRRKCPTEEDRYLVTCVAPAMIGS